jgi:hypothetical protein
VRQVQGLVPYMAFAVFIVGVTVVALVTMTLGLPVQVAEAPAASASAVATATTRPSTDLSTSGRLAYWRVEANGDYLLWLANADNSRRRSVTKADQPNSVSRTKWAVDGASIAYVESGVRLVVIRVDGVKTTYTLAPDLRADGYRIVDHRFSPSGLRVAASVQRATGSQSDVYVSGPGGNWTRLTTTEDVLVGDWLTEDELLVQTTGGIVGRLRASGKDQVRPLTGLAAATPIIGQDGRIYFLSGRVSGFAGASETLVYASSSSVWSMTAEGEDLRREGFNLPSDSLRLDGRWPGGGFLAHRGTNLAQAAFRKSDSEPEVQMPTGAGLIERLQVSPDDKFAIGFAGANLVRLDLAPTGAIGNLVVLLGSVAQGDAWFPRAVDLATVARARADVPAARYVFALGGHLWAMGADGLPALFRAGNTNSQTLRRFNLAPPVWSPAGDKVLTVESLSSGASAFQLVAVVISRDGTVKRYTTPSSVGTGVSWSPDGTQIAVAALPTAASDPSVLASDLNIAILDASSGTVARTIPGREATWTKGGIVVLTNGSVRTGDRARDDQVIEVWNGTTKRDLISIAKLVGDPRTQAPATTRGITQTTALTASPDGAYASVHLNFLLASPTFSFALVRARDSTATAIILDAVSDESWSPAGRNIGYTVTFGRGANARQRAVLRDAETGDVLADLEGRFAGWSPDGLWAYVARTDGLYARRVAGGELVRASLYGVPVSVTKP